jgi:hypothetical protein
MRSYIHSAFLILSMLFFVNCSTPDNAEIQFFPADERTIEERPARAINVWSKEDDRENKRYYYRLYLDGELRYEAEFDLSKPILLTDVVITNDLKVNSLIPSLQRCHFVLFEHVNIILLSQILGFVMR